jgi:hypothetical protein
MMPTKMKVKAQVKPEYTVGPHDVPYSFTSAGRLDHLTASTFSNYVFQLSANLTNHIKFSFTEKVCYLP